MKTDEEYGIIIIPQEYIELYKTHKEDGTLFHEGQRREVAFEHGETFPISKMLCDLHGKKCKVVERHGYGSTVRVFSGDPDKKDVVEAFIPATVVWGIEELVCQIDTSLPEMKQVASKIGTNQITITDKSAPKPEPFVLCEDYLQLGGLEWEVQDMNADNFFVNCTLVTSNPVLGLDTTNMAIRIPFMLLKFNNRQSVFGKGLRSNERVIQTEKDNLSKRTAK